MPSEKYFFQQKQRNFAQRFFKKGLNANAYILFALKESGEMFLRELPDCYPGFALMKKMFGVSKYKRPQFKEETFRVNLNRLRKQGLVKKDPEKKVYYLTEKGEKFVAYVKDRYSVLKGPWDGKLRLLIFDIPEDKKRWREWLRKELLLLQFQQLQKSVYIGKRPLPESFYKEMAEAGISEYVFILTAGDIDRKEEILKLFKE